MQKWFADTETCGLHGVPVLLQYAIDDGPVQLVDIWKQPIWTTLELIEKMMEGVFVGFNVSFDGFGICKLYSMLSLYPDKDAYPEDIIDDLGVLEEKARFLDLCIKPAGVVDVMIVARKGPYQSLMARSPIRIRRVPTALAWKLVDELERQVHFDRIYFARSKKKNEAHWRIVDIVHPNQVIDPHFKDIILDFKPSTALKNLYRHAYPEEDKLVIVYGDIEIDPKLNPDDLGYAPFAKALAPDGPADWKNTWPSVIRYHIDHWAYNSQARKYASNDVLYTRRLYLEKFGAPEPDNDSNLTWCVAACRWHGFAVDLDRLRGLKEDAQRRIKEVPTAPRNVKRWLHEVMDETEQAVCTSTGKAILTELSKSKDWILEDGTRHPVGQRAAQVLEARQAIKEIELFDKLLTAGRFHPSFKVMGTLSNRMAGADDLNAQGINHSKTIRSAFTLADRPQTLVATLGDGTMVPVEVMKTILSGGDFKSFEVSLAAKVFDDPVMNQELNSGIKVHGLMGQALFPGKTYQEILDSDGTANDMYDIGKKGFFLKCYFGEAHTFHSKLAIDLDIAEEANTWFNNKYPRAKVFQDWVRDRFGALSQPEGIGTRINWKTPADYAESFLGFKRYFTLENQVIRTLFLMAQSPPKSFQNVRIKVLRRDRMQTACGAVSSALYGAAFALMSANIRAAGNHYIQSPGAEITKATQCAVWDCQPQGIHPWVVSCLNIHDEIMCAIHPGHEDQVQKQVMKTVARYRELVPLLAIEWFNNISSWASKKGEPVPREPREPREPKEQELVA